MGRVHSFEPVIGQDPRILILGSMPGVVSLQLAQYYAHPRNAFWPIMAALFDIRIDCEYADRIRQVRHLPLVLWDTLKACHREGSLDSSIQEQRLEANDIPALLGDIPAIRLVAFNGAVSEKYFKKLVMPGLLNPSGLELIRMPSTSPANAGMGFDEKLSRWRRLLDFLG